MSDKKNVVILGGGLCGMYSGITLLRNGYDVTIIEKANFSGGLANGIKHGNNYYDYGVHMLHAHDKEIFEDIKKIMGDKRIEVNLDARIRWQGKFYHYPLQFMDLITGMNQLKLIRCIIGLFYAQLRYKLFPKEPKDAHEALNQLYGRSLAKFFFIEFTEKYWGIPTHNLSATFITSKMPRLTAVDFLKKILSMVGFKEKKGLAVDSALNKEILHYSKKGARCLVEELTNEYDKLGGKIFLESKINKINLYQNKIDNINFEYQSKNHTFKCHECISTIPLNNLFSYFSPKISEDVKESADKIRYKAIVIYGLLIKKERCIEGLYIYYRKHIFHRVCEPKNAGMEVNPKDHTVLVIEMTCNKNDSKWNGEPEVIEQMLSELEEENILNKKDVVEVNKLVYPHGYPLYDLGFEKYHQKLKNYIKDINNIQSIGRQGGFCFPGMHKSMRIGKDAAQKIIDKSNDNTNQNNN